MSGFSDPELLSDYGQRTMRIVPGLSDLHRMSAILLAERAPVDANILVLGAGGGMELKALSELQPGWRFCGVDPSAPMLDLARRELEAQCNRISLLEGYIGDAPDGPFDGACCLLTLHFLPEAERLKTLCAVHRRLKPGAAFVTAHHSFSRDGAMADVWLDRAAAFAVSPTLPRDRAGASNAAMKARLPALSPEQDVALLRQAGFIGVELFYAAFTFRGWVAYAVAHNEKTSPSRRAGQAA